MYTRSDNSSKDHLSNDNSNINTADFFEAISNNDKEKFNAFLESATILISKIKDENGCTALHKATFHNNYELTNVILQEVKKGYGLGGSSKIADYINLKTTDGFTAFHYAAMNGNIKIIQLLKDYGGKIESVTSGGKNCLHIAAENNQISMIIYLLFNEPLDITSVDENGSTPLHLACYYGSFESVRYLLSLKSNINAVDNEKLTPLHLAVRNEKEKIVKLLLLNGADKNITNKNQELPIDIARKKNCKKIINLLSDKEYNPLCTLEAPVAYIEPKNTYKKLIFIMILIPEIIIFFLVLPFIESMSYTYINFASLFLCLFSYILLLTKDPGYLNNNQYLDETDPTKNLTLKNLVEKEIDLKNYCPVCYIDNSDSLKIKHCFICKKCVSELSHHCFWINKCIGKNNKTIYLIFLVCAFFYTFYSIFLCSNLLFDSVYIPYEKTFPPSSLNFIIDRGFRVLGAGVVIVFAIIVSFPLFFLIMIEIMKYIDVKKKSKEEIPKQPEQNNRRGTLELENNNNKEPLVSEENKENDANKINDSGLNIPSDNFPLGRPSIDSQ